MCQRGAGSGWFEAIHGDVNSRSRNGRAPLQTAAEAGHKEIVELLLDHGANIKARNKDGMTALAWVVKNSHKDVAAVLLAHGANEK